MVKLIRHNPKHAAKEKKQFLQRTRVYAQLRAAVIDAGILQRSYGYYTVLCLFAFAGFLATAYALFITHAVGYLVLWSLLFTFFAVQVGGLLHDAGHRAVFKSPTMNDILGYISGFLLAQSYGYWKYKHNRHHAHPNQEDEDDDIEIPFIAFTPERLERRSGLQRLLRRYQAYLYYPIGLLAALSARYGSILYFRDFFHPGLIWEIVPTIAAMFIWFVWPFFLFDLQKAVLLEVLVNGAMGFYLLQIFAPNHKGMPELQKGVRLAFIEQQIITSRNIAGNWLVDFFYLGLNYQMEHHLFPACPRNKLPRLAPLVKDVCRQIELPYVQVSVLETNKIILSELHKVGNAA